MKRLTLTLLLGISVISSVTAAYTIRNLEFSIPSRSAILSGDEITVTFDYTSNRNNFRLELVPLYLDQVVETDQVYDLVLTSKSGTASLTFSLSEGQSMDEIRFRFTHTYYQWWIYKTVKKSAEFTFNDWGASYLDFNVTRIANLNIGDLVEIDYSFANSLNANIQVIPIFQGIPLEDTEYNNSISSTLIAGSAHEVTSSFTLNNEGEVDEILFLATTETLDTIWVTTVPVQYSFSTPQNYEVDMELVLESAYRIKATVKNVGNTTVEDWHATLLMEDFDTIWTTSDVQMIKFGDTKLFFKTNHPDLLPGENIQFWIESGVEYPCIPNISNFRIKGQVVGNLSIIDERQTDQYENNIIIYPNPAVIGEGTKICFGTSIPGYAEVFIYNRYGSRVVTLYSGQLGSGIHELEWDHTQQGVLMPEGTYYAYINTVHGNQYRSFIIYNE